uniref:Uncharacterized protein n=1 Tax=Knipowitschia caucasica TaxID=637954 RepID=A0AAV2KPA8_KNICA
MAHSVPVLRSMASLYSDPDWSQSLGAHMASLVSAQNVGLDQTLSWVQDMAQREDFSLTDVWGALTSAGIMKQWDTRKLSGEAQRNASNPYPVYGAIEKRCFNQGPIQGTAVISHSVRDLRPGYVTQSLSDPVVCPCALSLCSLSLCSVTMLCPCALSLCSLSLCSVPVLSDPVLCPCALCPCAL